MQTDHFMIHHFFQWPSHEWVQHHWCCAWKWESLVGIHISYPSWCWSAMVCSRLLSCSSMYQDAIQLARGCGCFGRWFSGILWQQQRKGQMLGKLRFTLACTASVNSASCWVETSPVADLRGPRKKTTFSGRRVLPLYAEVSVLDPKWQRECSVMLLSKLQRTNEDTTQIESH